MPRSELASTHLYEVSDNVPDFFPELIARADKHFIVCMDERELDMDDPESRRLDGYNPVNLPGGTYIFIDMLKKFRGMNEEEAWKFAARKGLPFGAHPHCGYAGLRERDPGSLLVKGDREATEENRLENIREFGAGKAVIPSYMGDHAINYAVLNYKPGFSIDQDQRAANGIMSCDVWYVREFAPRLELDPDQVVAHTEQVFVNAVLKLTHDKIGTFYRYGHLSRPEPQGGGCLALVNTLFQRGQPQ